ncbi:hypothetical protein G3545_08410 [Starkeya sp. ORNL1]|uniref:hypothetical protein n=1 Tax=Starkeya sp. ORNL1 TaxID=2709380 RepID=UPI0014644922|nr:hypothetical protein [Starkeya sp. ORNL1]QJP13675.1 hypothetical protein G3545_08410 [Starkeya sp. ORNL1]
MTFPIPPQIWAKRPITSLWTDFTNAYNGKTLIGSYPVGVSPSGWTSSGTTGFTTDIVALGDTTSGQALRVRGAATTGNSGSLIWDHIVPAFDVEVLMGVYVDATGGTVASRQIGSVIRRSSATDSVIFALFDSTDRDQIEINIGPISPSYAVFSWQLGTWYWMRMRSQGDDYVARVWRKVDPEPSAWTATLTDSSLTLPGQIGVSGSSRTPALIYCDFFSVSLDGTPAYGPGL